MGSADNTVLENIPQRNMVFARFMGMTAERVGDKYHVNLPGAATRFIIAENEEDLANYLYYRYHESWDCLMDVGKRIHDILIEIHNWLPSRHTCCEGDLIEVDIQCHVSHYEKAGAYNCMYKFVEWYNNNRDTIQKLEYASKNTKDGDLGTTTA